MKAGRDARFAATHGWAALCRMTHIVNWECSWLYLKPGNLRCSFNGFGNGLGVMTTWVNEKPSLQDSGSIVNNP